MIRPILDRLMYAGRVLIKGIPSNTNGKQIDIFDIPPISPEEIAEAKIFFPREKFFIFGHARSGTTLLTRLVRLHPDVYCNYQAHFFSRAPLLQSLVTDPEVRAWLTRRSNRWNRGKDLSPVVLRAVADYIMERDAHQVGKRIVGDKSPNSLLDGKAVRLLHQIYPDARLIFIVRDGRDAALSHRFQAFIDSPQHLSKADLQIRDDFMANPDPYLHGERSLFTEKGLRQAALGWVRNVTETDQEGRQMYGEHYVSLRYEDLLNHPANEIKHIWQFLGADITNPELDGIVTNEMTQNPDADWQRQKAGELISPLEKGKKGSWRVLFTERDRNMFAEIAGQTLANWGYEKS